jgi:tRNA threonylcarbamoyladenosine biosynthesis protein TsaE
MQERTIQDLAELRTFAAELLGALPVRSDHATVLALSGELGAGKTALVQALAAELGVREHVTSPTFILMHSYETASERFRQLVHIDAYRIEDTRELAVLKLDEVFADPTALVCIEWPERVGAAAPNDAVHINIESHTDDTRTITYSYAR